MQPQARRLSEQSAARPLRRAEMVVTHPAAFYRWTPWAIALTCALTPAYVIRPRLGSFPTTVLELALLATLAVYLVERFSMRSAPAAVPLKGTLARNPYLIPLLLFVIAGAISVAVSSDHRPALGLYKAYIVEPALLFLVMIDVVRARRELYMVIGGLALAGMVAGLANGVVLAHAALFHQLNLAVAAPVIIYNNANSLALFLVPLIAMAAAIAVRIPGVLRVLAVVFLVVAVGATLLSFSRGGFLALGAVLLGLALADRRRAWLAPAVIVAAAIFSRIPAVAHRLSHEFSTQDPNNTLHQRLVLWQTTLRMLRDHPIFGAGLSGFKAGIAPYHGGPLTEDLVYPHNILLNFWSEVGLLGVAAFAWIFGLAVVSAVRAWRRLPEPWAAIGLGVLLALVAILAHGLVDVPYWKNDLSVEFWALLALPVAGLRWARPRSID